MSQLSRRGSVLPLRNLWGFLCVSFCWKCQWVGMRSSALFDLLKHKITVIEIRIKEICWTSDFVFAEIFSGSPPVSDHCWTAFTLTLALTQHNSLYVTHASHSLSRSQNFTWWQFVTVSASSVQSTTEGRSKGAYKLNTDWRRREYFFSLAPSCKTFLATDIVV